MPDRPLGIKVFFVVMTAAGRETLACEAVKNLKSQAAPYDRIVIVHGPGVDTSLLPKDIPHFGHPSKHNLAQAHNVAIRLIVDESYFCSMHDDIAMAGPDWVNRFINFYETKPQRIGVLGVERHSNSECHCTIDEFKGVVWADGVFFLRTALLSKVGPFDEELVADCDQMDYCYRIKALGYCNFRWTGKFLHARIAYDKKASDYATFRDLSNISRIRFTAKHNVLVDALP